MAVETKKLNGGSLRSASYDTATRKMVVELTSGKLEYSNISADMFRRFTQASSPWSFYRDNIEEELTGRRV
jgi:uncharacterized phage-associated protein